MACLDTDILVAILCGEEDAATFIKKAEKSGEALSTTPINSIELYKGAFRSKHPEENIVAVERLLASLDLLSLGLRESKEVGCLIEELRSRGESIGDFDTVIAGIVRAHREVLVTRNIKHFQQVPGLPIQSW
ncbi:MAG: type II toxin-antitoxin system VapC family toxin [Thermoplasmata archaeon]